MQENRDKVAIVTGAAKNIGRATSECLSKLGFNILVHANSDKNGAKETLDIVKKNGVNAGILIGDLTNKETSKLFVSEGQKLGIISVLINNASQREFNKFDDMTFEQWRFVMSIILIHYFIPVRLSFQRWKKIIGEGL